MSSRSMACGPQLVRRLQEHAARALPAERVEHVGGWWLRSLQVAATPHVLRQSPKDPLRVRVDDDPTAAWFDVWHTVHGQGRDSHAEWRMLGRVARPAAYASAMIGKGVVAVGRVVADDGWAGVFGMATLPHARAKGAGRTVLAALADWAHGHGADRLYLQVQRDNPPALRLYAGAGFGDVCEYHYRTAGWASAPGTQRSAPS